MVTGKNTAVVSTFKTIHNQKTTLQSLDHLECLECLEGQIIGSRAYSCITLLQVIYDHMQYLNSPRPGEWMTAIKNRC